MRQAIATVMLATTTLIIMLPARTQTPTPTPTPPPPTLTLTMVILRSMTQTKFMFIETHTDALPSTTALTNPTTLISTRIALAPDTTATPVMNIDMNTATKDTIAVVEQQESSKLDTLEALVSWALAQMVTVMATATAISPTTNTSTLTIITEK